MARRRVVMALMFFPRGGSSQVVRYLSRFLPARGWEVTLVTGSLGAECAESNARTFFAGADVHTVDYSAGVPMHPSYEDRPGAPDVVFAKVGDHDFERIVATWRAALERAGAADADLLHLNHLTPIHEAAIRYFPDVPRAGHLHGTELLMLGEIANGARPDWDHAAAWPARRWCCWAATPASGRASTRSRSSARPAQTTCSWPAGTATRTWATGSTPPTSSSCRRSTSSSARC